jgi:2-succinyl-5-enolpyruvyl-6-hydroxy-3-cyclohexene-1-carboxylate synthase
VVCTSGTAAANLHPAVIEASHAGVPLLVLTADRPPELVGTGANQTIAQAGLYGGAVRLTQVFGVAEARTGQNALWRSAVCRAVAAATGALTGDPGPVHVNVPFREPLVPGQLRDPWPEPLDGRDGGASWTALPSPVTGAGRAASAVEHAVPTLLIAGHGAGRVMGSGPPQGWPLIAEPGSGCWGGEGSLRTGPWLLGANGFLADHLPRRVVVVGRPTLHRSVQELLGRDDVEVVCVTDRPGWTDVAGAANQVLRALPHEQGNPAGWLEAWTTADRTVAAALDEVLDAQPWPSGVQVARELVAALPSGALLVLGSSNSVRDVALTAVARDDLVVLANRGVAGIDGTVSTALGAALVHDRASYALLGDLTFLHDVTGLVLGPQERRPDLTIVVLNDEGGGIFSLLEQGAAEYEPSFERVFGTPHRVDVAALCGSVGIEHRLASTAAELAVALKPAPGVRVVEVRADRHRLRDLHARLRAAVDEALDGC